MVRYTDEYRCANAAEALVMLREKGVAVVTSVLGDDESIVFRHGIWELAEHLTSLFTRPMEPVLREAPWTWYNWHELSPTKGMLVQHYGVGHAQVLWDIRQHPQVAKVFADIYSIMSGSEIKTTDMITSFDAFSLLPEPEHTNRGWDNENVSGLHVDQGSTSSEFQYYQGLVNLEKVEIGGATFEVVPGSHKIHAELFSTFGLTIKKNWHILDTQQLQFLKEQKLETVRILAGQGDMILWDSRTVHCGGRVVKGREICTTRVVSYVCMVPRSRASEKTLAKRIACIEVPEGQELRTTTHVPDKPIMFGKRPRTYGKSMPDVATITTRPILTKLGRRLAGYEEEIEGVGIASFLGKRCQETRR